MTRLGFDLDGVVADITIALFRVADMLPEQLEIYKWLMRTAKLQLNPVEFLVFDDDEYYIITSRDNDFKEITEKWVLKYCPHVKELIILDNDVEPMRNLTDDKILDWLDNQVKLKADAINKHKIEVYFEDSTYVVKKLRKLCPNCKIVNYGGRV